MRWPKYTAGGYVLGSRRREQRERERAWQGAERAEAPVRRGLPLVEVARGIIREFTRGRPPPTRVTGGRYRPRTDDEKGAR